MPEIGEIKKGQDLGFTRYYKFIWRACVDCGKERWVRLKRGQPKNRYCLSCAHKGNSGGKGSRGMWKAGCKHKIKNSSGYIEIKLQPNDSFYPMASKGGYILEHRLVVAKRLGRCLLKSEHVHHIDGIKDHNKDNNLQLLSQADHSIKIQLCQHCSLRQDIRMVQLQNKMLLEQIRNLNLRLMDVGILKGVKI